MNSCSKLFDAVKFGRLQEVQQLIRSGVNVNCRDEVPKTLVSFSYHTPLFYAEDAQIIAELLQAGADVSAQNDDGDSVLHIYVKSSRNADAISTLIQAGANVNCINFKAERPIHFAMHSDFAVIKLLLQHGADINSQDILGRTPLTWIATRSMKQHHCNELMVNCGQMQIDINENRVEHYVVQRFWTSQQDTAEIQPECKNIFGVSTRYGWLTETLTVNERFNSITEPELQTLLNSDVAIDNYGNTFVHYVMRYYMTKVSDSKEQMNILSIIKQADHLNSVRNKFGFTPLVGAIRKMNTGMGCMAQTMYQLLLMFSKDLKSLKQLLSAENFLGQNLWHFAPNHRFLFDKFLTACDQLMTTPIDSEGDAGKLFMINEIINQSLNAQDKLGRTPLHYVAIRNYGVVLDRMLYSVNSIDSIGRTPLHYAAFGDKLYMKFIEAGANENVRDVHGLTPKQLKEMCDLISSEYDDKISKSKSLEKRMWEMANQFTEDNASAHSLAKSDDSSAQSTNFILYEMWENAVLASHESITAHVKKQLTTFMNHLTDFISKVDKRFKCWPMLVGSEFEETKLEKPDEFDFNVILVNFGNMIEVQESPTCPQGFVHLKRRNMTSRECLYKRFNYQSFFSEDGFLLTRRIKVEFMALVERAIYSDQFWCEMFADIFLVSSMDTITTFKDPFGENNVVTLRLMITSLTADGRCFPHAIDIDITPVIWVPNWWPDGIRHLPNLPFAPHNCHLILKSPQAYYAWAPYHTESNNSFARITFSIMESEIIRSSPMSCKAAFIVSKLICCRTLKPEEGGTDHVFKTYAIKTAFMTCLSKEKDLLKQSAKMHDTVDRSLMQLWLQKIFDLLVQYARQDFIPFFFIPACQLPVFSCEKYLKYFHMQSHLNGKENQLDDRYENKLTQCFQLKSIVDRWNL